MIEGFQRFIAFLTLPITNYKLKARDKKVDQVYREFTQNLSTFKSFDELKSIKGVPEKGDKTDFLIRVLNKFVGDTKFDKGKLPTTINFQDNFNKLKADKIIADFKEYKGDKAKFWENAQKTYQLSFGEFLKTLAKKEKPVTADHYELITLGINTPYSGSIIDHFGGEEGIRYVLAKSFKNKNNNPLFGKEKELEAALGSQQFLKVICSQAQGYPFYQPLEKKVAALLFKQMLTAKNINDFWDKAKINYRLDFKDAASLMAPSIGLLSKVVKPLVY